MSMTRRNLLAGAAVASAVLPGLRAESGVKQYVRYRQDRKVAFGELEGDTIYPLEGSVLGARKRAGGKHAVGDVKPSVPGALAEGVCGRV